MIRFVNVYGGLSRAVWSYKSYVFVVMLGYSLLVVLFFHNHLLVDNETRSGPPKGRAGEKETIALREKRSNSRMMRDQLVGSRTMVDSFRDEIITEAEPPESSNRDESRNGHAFPLAADCSSSSKEFRFSRNETAFQKLGDHYLYSAYFDDREDNEYPVIRVIALLRKSERLQFFCHVPTKRVARRSNAFAQSERNAGDGGENKRRYRSSSRLGEFKSIVYRSEDQSESDWSVEYTNIAASLYQMCENHNKTYGGWILSCRLTAPLSETHRAPCEVLVSTDPGYNASSSSSSSAAVVGIPVFRVRSRGKQDRHSFGICVPPLFGHIPSTTLVEFVEFSRLLGAEHFIVYRHEVSTEVAKALAFYASRGLVTTVRWDLPVDETLVWYHGQLVAVNDCLYRAMHAFRYLAFNDVDEFIVPHAQMTWSEMASSLRRSLASDQRLNRNEASKLPLVNGLRPPSDKTSLLSLDVGEDGLPEGLLLRKSPSPRDTRDFAGFSFQSAFFDPLLSGLISHVMYDLESDLRTKTFSRVRSKVMVVPEAIFELGIHHVSRTLADRYTVHHVPTAVAFVHHYRKCANEFDPAMNCHVFAHDESLSRHLPSIRHNIHQTLWQMKEAAVLMTSPPVASSVRKEVDDVIQDGL